MSATNTLVPVIETNLDSGETVVNDGKNELKVLMGEIEKFNDDDDDKLPPPPTRIPKKLPDIPIKVVKKPERKPTRYVEELDDSNSIFHNVKDLFRGMDIDLSNVMLYAARVVEFVDVFQTGDGDEKKEIVVQTLLNLINENLDISSEDKEFIVFMLDGLIETILKTSKKEINLATKHAQKKPSLDQSVGQIVDSLVDRCVTIIRVNQYDAENVIINIPIIVGMIMSIVENYKNLSGTEKKNVVVKVIKNLIGSRIPTFIDLNESHNKKLELVVQIVPSIIDVLIDVANGRYNINEVISFCKKWCCCKPSKKSKIQKDKKNEKKNKKKNKRK
tara:strand:- start:405 stop:1400 length:996 start_codon:yes stop_codon:yes gene_type:complete